MDPDAHGFGRAGRELAFTSRPRGYACPGSVFVFPAATGSVGFAWIDSRPLPGYAGAQASVIRSGGFQVPVAWPNGANLGGLPDRIRIKVSFEGAKKEEIRFHALYVQDAAK